MGGGEIIAMLDMALLAILKIVGTAIAVTAGAYAIAGMVRSLWDNYISMQ